MPLIEKKNEGNESSFILLIKQQNYFICNFLFINYKNCIIISFYLILHFESIYISDKPLLKDYRPIYRLCFRFCREKHLYQKQDRFWINLSIFNRFIRLIHLFHASYRNSSRLHNISNSLIFFIFGLDLSDDALYELVAIFLSLKAC